MLALNRRQTRTQTDRQTDKLTTIILVHAPSVNYELYVISGACMLEGELERKLYYSNSRLECNQ